MSLYSLVDATKCITLNILRSGGLPNITVSVNFVVCSLVMTPMGYYLAISRHDGLGGLWLSMSVAWGLATVAYGVILSRLDLRSLKVIAD
jgi:Na+-driven multidrug efflux pump